MQNFADAVKQLREHLGDSQQAFATRVGLSIRAVANYEKDRIPTGEVLTALYRVARASGEDRLAKIFWNAVHDELGLSESTGRKINDAHIGVGAAEMRLRMLLEDPAQSETLTDKQRAKLTDIATRLAKAQSTLEGLDPYSRSLKVRKEK